MESWTRRPASQRLQLRHYALAALVAGAIAVWPGACSRGRVAPAQGDAERRRPPRSSSRTRSRTCTGKEVKLADYAGKPLILNFWATWCGPCKDEIPGLVAISQKYKDKG